MTTGLPLALVLVALTTTSDARPPPPSQLVTPRNAAARFDVPLALCAQQPPPDCDKQQEVYKLFSASAADLRGRRMLLAKAKLRGMHAEIVPQQLQKEKEKEKIPTTKQQPQQPQLPLSVGPLCGMNISLFLLHRRCFLARP